MMESNGIRTNKSPSNSVSVLCGQITDSNYSSEVSNDNLSDTFHITERPAIGQLGNPIKVCANLFMITMNPQSNIYLYEVVINEDRLPSSLNRELISIIVDRYRHYFDNITTIYDGRRKLYTNAPIRFNQDKSNIEITLPGEYVDQKFSVKIRFVCKVEPGCHERIYALHTLLKHYSSLSFSQAGSSFFEDSRRKCAALGSGREIWFGFHQSIRSTQFGTMLNIDVLATAFYKEMSVIDFMRELFDPCVEFIDDSTLVMSDNQRSRLAREMKGLRIYTNHVPSVHRRYRVCNVTRKCANTQLFPLSDDKGLITEISVAEYFMQKYGYELRYAHLPCLQVGREEKHVYLPVEVCIIMKGQRCSKKLTDAQTSAMIKITAKSAPDRVQATTALAEKLSAKLCDENNGFEISVQSNMAQIDGRVLPAPRILYGGRTRQVAVPDKGIWDMRGKQYFCGVEIHTWAIACFAQSSVCNELTILNFIGSIHHIANDNGMLMAARPCFCKYAISCDQVEPMFKCIQCAFPSIQLIIIILPGKTPIYAEVKRVGDSVVGITTQCVQAKHLSKLNSQTLSNLCLKINVKLGGVNSILLPQSRPPIFNEPIIFIGADLCHPPNGDPIKPTIVAGPMNMGCTVPLAILIKSESISELDVMVVDLLKRFYQKTHFKPTRLFYFRNAVPESATHRVLSAELTAIRNACLMLQSSYEPGVTFITVQKNHHTRLFCSDRRNMSGRSGNVPAGTIVDCGITDPVNFDFYLCSHSGVQGTSRPCRYHILWDDNKMQSDEIQTLIYQLCHTYARCTRAVSVPAPIYYAHLAIQRARYHCTEREFETGIPFQEVYLLHPLYCFKTLLVQ